MVYGREGDPRIVAPTASNFSCDCARRHVKAARPNGSHGVQPSDHRSGPARRVGCDTSAERPCAAGFGFAPRPITYWARTRPRARAHTRTRSSLLESTWNPVSDSSARNVMDGHRSQPFSSPTMIGGAGPSNVSRGRSSVETSAVPPHDFVRSPGRMEFGEGPISARSPTEPLPKSVVSFDERPHRRVRRFRLGKENCISFQPSQRKFRQWSTLSGSYSLGDVLGPSLHHATPAFEPAFEKIVPEICSLDASNRMRQRRLRDLLGLLRIGAPVPERASETKWNLLNTRFPEQLARSRIRR